MNRSCQYQSSVTSGTIFHKSRTPLIKWFWLIFRMATSRTGVSIWEMKRELDIKDYKTIWVMAHKVRKAMLDRDSNYKLAGLVEIDEAYFGPSSSGKRGRGSERKTSVIVAVSTRVNQKGEERAGFGHAFVVDNNSAETIEKVLKQIGTLDAEVKSLIDKIRTDGWRSYQTVSKRMGIIHHRIILSGSQDTMKVLPWTHRLIANAKAVLDGTHRKSIEVKHLQRYLSEVCYRFNRRFWHEQAFHRLLRACTTTQTITRDELME